MRYAIIVYESENDFQCRGDGDVVTKEAYWGAFSAYYEGLTEAEISKGREPEKVFLNTGST